MLTVGSTVWARALCPRPESTPCGCRFARLASGWVLHLRAKRGMVRGCAVVLLPGAPPVILLMALLRLARLPMRSSKSLRCTQHLRLRRTTRWISSRRKGDADERGWEQFHLVGYPAGVCRTRVRGPTLGAASSLALRQPGLVAGISARRAGVGASTTGLKRFPRTSSRARSCGSTSSREWSYRRRRPETRRRGWQGVLAESGHS